MLKIKDIFIFYVMAVVNFFLLIGGSGIGGGDFFVVFQNNKYKPPNEANNEYILFSRKNYDIMYNGETLYNIRSEPTWTIYN